MFAGSGACFDLYLVFVVLWLVVFACLVLFVEFWIVGCSWLGCLFCCWALLFCLFWLHLDLFLLLIVCGWVCSGFRLYNSVGLNAYFVLFGCLLLRCVVLCLFFVLLVAIVCGLWCWFGCVIVLLFIMVVSAWFVGRCGVCYVCCGWLVVSYWFVGCCLLLLCFFDCVVWVVMFCWFFSFSLFFFFWFDCCVGY